MGGSDNFYKMPSSHDGPIWDVWLSSLWMPSVTAAEELGILDSLADQVASTEELSERLDLNLRALNAVLPMLTALGFLVTRQGHYHVTETTRNFLLKDSPYYWGGILERARINSPHHASLIDVLTAGTSKGTGNWANTEKPSDGWAAGKIDREQARLIAYFMHGHSLPAALGAARNGGFSSVSRLLDVGGGSGCYSIALAQAYTNLHCTVMDLPTMCAEAENYINTAGVSDRVDTVAVDMFREQWPTGYDALLFSNIFHDWSFDTCTQLAKNAFDVLPTGGRIYLHEMLLDDSGVAPTTATAFSLLMLLGTEGQQFTFEQLCRLLENAGFSDVKATATYAYFSVICGYKR
jgi:hypothetical protein